MLKKLIIPLVILSTLIAMGLLWRQNGSAPPAGPKTTGLPMKVSKYFWSGQLWKEIAVEKGWFKEAGLNVELIDTNPDYFSSLQNMVDGKMDSNNFTVADFLKYRTQGVDLVAVIVTDESQGAEGIVAKKEIENIRGLKEKKIGVSKDTYLQYILSVVLKRNGLKIGDVILVNIPAEETVEEFVEDRVDAIISWEPFVAEAAVKGRGRKLFDTSEIPGISPSIETFHRSFIEERPGDVHAFVNVWSKTTQFIKENPEAAFRIIARIYNKTLGDVQALVQTNKILDIRDNITAFSYGSGFESLHGTIRKLNEFMKDQGLTREYLDSMELLDDRFVRSIDRVLN